jgi:glycosyltransferase involved in cell wall biosynthesis
MSERIPVLYLAPWVGFGGSDKNTIDWFRWIDRDRFAPSLITTQPSPNPLIDEVLPFAEEIWVLPDLMPAAEMPRFIFDFLQTRDIRVLHLMNSRIGFDLLPDLASLPSPPSVVVQMHAEETDRSGYVRYVTTRYGDLVDRFSLSNEHVATAVRGYGIPEEKIEVIYTGVDPDEFSPERAQPIEELPDDRLQILFAARLVAQKDPLLMVDVAAALRDEEAKFQIHVVGEGDLEEQIEERVEALGLADHVILHPPTPGLLSWYAACDVLLLTSVFEGVPVVIFEAMAMGMPVVTPGLPAIRELLDADDDGVVLPRESVDGYVAPLAHLAGDRAHLAAWGREMRARAKEQFSVQQMAGDHGKLYEELVAAQGNREEEAGARSEPATGGRGAAALSIVSLASEELGSGLESAQAPIVALTLGTRSSLEVDPAFGEKVLRRFSAAGEELDAIALADAGPEGRFHFRALVPEDSPRDLVPHTVIWRRSLERDLPQGLQADPEAPVVSIARLLSGAGTQLEWRHLPAPEMAPSAASTPPSNWTPMPASPGPTPSTPAPEPLPGTGEYRVPRWDLTPTWVPPTSSVAVRYRERGGERRLVTSGPPPSGFEEEHVLGSLRSTEFQGTAKLIATEGTYRVFPTDQDQQVGDDATEIGYVELAPLPGMDTLTLAVHRATGQHVLVSPDDPLLPEVDLVEHLGFVDPTPLKPRQMPPAQRPLGLLGLVKAVDYAARRHRYAIGAVPAGEPIAELGSLAESPLQGSIPAGIVDGYLVTDRHRPPTMKPGYRDALPWAVEPVAWHGLAPWRSRVKALASRSRTAAAALRHRTDRSVGAAVEPAGWLFKRARPGLVTLFAAYHPITGDQLLVRDAASATNLGYSDPELLGYLRSEAPLTGRLDEQPVPIPWARRFGHVPRPG